MPGPDIHVFQKLHLPQVSPRPNQGPALMEHRLPFCLFADGETEAQRSKGVCPTHIPRFPQHRILHCLSLSVPSQHPLQLSWSHVTSSGQ
jgi:hypothetical protein